MWIEWWPREFVSSAQRMSDAQKNYDSTQSEQQNQWNNNETSFHDQENMKVTSDALRKLQRTLWIWEYKGEQWDNKQETFSHPQETNQSEYTPFWAVVDSLPQGQEFLIDWKSLTITKSFAQRLEMWRWAISEVFRQNDLDKEASMLQDAMNRVFNNWDTSWIIDAYDIFNLDNVHPVLYETNQINDAQITPILDLYQAVINPTSPFQYWPATQSWINSQGESTQWDSSIQQEWTTEKKGEEISEEIEKSPYEEAYERVKNTVKKSGVGPFIPFQKAYHEIQQFPELENTPEVQSFLEWYKESLLSLFPEGNRHRGEVLKRIDSLDLDNAISNGFDWVYEFMIQWYMETNPWNKRADIIETFFNK